MSILSFGSTTIAMAGGLGLLLVFLRGVYYAFFHPLAKVPGPKFYSFSQIPYLYHLLHGDWVRTLKKCHDQYGPVVRFTPNDVSFTTPDAWKHIYGHKTSRDKTFDKDLRGYQPTLSGDPHLLIANDEDHKRMRRLLAHAFSEKALRGQEDIIKLYIDLLIAKLNEQVRKGDAVVDMVQWYNFTTFDLIGDLAFGEPFGCLESGGYHPWVAMIFDRVRLSTYSHVLRRIHPILVRLQKLIIPRKVIKHSLEHWQLSAGTAKRRLESGDKERADFMSYILRHNDGKGMSVGEIVENANLLIVAGSETTATALSGTTFNLLKNPDTYNKLVKEIRTSFESEEEITMLSVNKLEYMPAVFNEGLRMYPPVPIGFPRSVPTGGEFIEGYWLPEKTSVSVHQWSSYHSKQNWLEPEKFIPERWLDDARFAHDVKGVLQPFSTGPRNCIGKNLAYAEMRLILVRVLWNFDLELMPESSDWNLQDVFTLWNKGKLKVKLTPAARGYASNRS